MTPTPMAVSPFQKISVSIYVCLYRLIDQSFIGNTHDHLNRGAQHRPIETLNQQESPSAHWVFSVF